MLGIHEGLNHPPGISNVEKNSPKTDINHPVVQRKPQGEIVTIQSIQSNSFGQCFGRSLPRQPLHSVPSSPELAQKQSTMHGAPWISMTTPSSAKPFPAPSPTPQQGSRSTPEPPEHSTFPTASKAIGSTDRTHPISFALTAGGTTP